ncbi:hypothetical protein VKT23_011166 [Stygiomarasmius scandens]|uniref:Heterokaryon incompatibility domain-containing protein n=1 Tax=Marasmiellus scandens TaxID=2682957 RepID=A0ABR1JA29_9AGAR
MRLLDTSTFQLAEFYSDIPKYAILSHTWEKEEVTFQDIQNLEIAKRRAGWAKVEGACAYARKYKFQWIWIDCCCINKESSTELSEAINSMYQYYFDSEVCYVYLSDVPQERNPQNSESAFRRSRWFTRGWTLQELLAPAFAVFLTQNWTELGTKWSLRHAISAITSIPPGVLEDGDVYKYSVAQRMSWAAQRKTTRPEDQAYCLMGIFDVNMPPIYGEGSTKAFMRLQQEIIKLSDDHSIFVWTAAPGEIEPRGLLAKSPYEFRASGGVQFNSRRTIGTDAPFSFNNNGLQIHLPLISTFVAPRQARLLLAYLSCQVGSGGDGGGYIYIYLQKRVSGHYVRCFPSEWLLYPEFLPEYKLQQVVVRENTLLQGPSRMSRRLSLGLPYSLIAQNCSYCENLGWKPPIRSLVYKVDGTEEYFAILKRSEDLHQLTFITEATKPSIFEVMAHPSESHLGTSSALSEYQTFGQDRLQAPLRNGGLVTLAIHITGENPVFEVSCLSPEDHSIPTTLTATQGFLVPMTMFHRDNHPASALLNVYAPLNASMPLDCVENGKHLYIPITDTDIQLRSFRVLHYLPYRRDTQLLPSSYSVLGNVFLAFGFHKTRFWVDLIVFGTGFREKVPKISEVWNSYLDDGSRAKARLECQVSVSRRVPWLPVGHGLTVTVEDMRLGTHCVVRVEANDKRFESPTVEGNRLKPKKSAYSLFKDRIKGSSSAS